MDKPTRVVDQPVFRVGVLLVGLVMLFFMARQLTIPKSFGAYGYFRGDNVQEQVNLVTAYSAGCAKCHPQELSTKGQGPHVQVNCESCHGPSGKHSDAPYQAQFKPTIDRSKEACLACHSSEIARPQAVIRQVNFQHYADKSCLTCHNPHDPVAKKGGN